MILACQNISKSYGTDEILKNVSFHIEAGEKVAILGINGAGKTTLLKIIIGIETADSGQVIIAKDTEVGYLSQHQDISFDNTVYGEMLETKRHIIELSERISALENDMQHAEGEKLQDILETYNRLTTKFEHENGYAYKSEINGVLKGLGFTESDYDRHINTLSGGQKMRIALGRLLLTKPDILILDEPTNHLDVSSISWLENFLSSYKGSVIVVSHDRYFIDKVTSKIVEIDNGTSTVYNGNYSYYSEKRAKIRADKMKAYLNQQREIRHQEEVITKLKSFNREKSIKRAESREKMLAKIDVLEKPYDVPSEMRLSLTPSTETGEDVLYIEGLTKAFGDNLLFRNLSIDIKRGEHVALIGGNGTGKTTILKMINRLIPKDSGTINLGSRVKIGYYDQDHQVLSLNKTIFEEISDAYPELGNTRIRNVLAAFLFTGDDVFKKIENLSGGERGRVSLAKLMLSPANFLILDEPTNHLDVQSKEILEQALKNYTGTVLFVSHDRYFINQTATRILELRNKVITNYKGNYDYYLAHKEELYNIQNSGNVNASVNETTSRYGFSQISSGGADTTDSDTDVFNAQNSSLTPQASGKDEYLKNKADKARIRKIENDIKKLEKSIEDSENRISEIDEEINLPENATNAVKLTELSAEKESLEESLLSMYEKWEELSNL